MAGDDKSKKNRKIIQSHIQNTHIHTYIYILIWENTYILINKMRPTSNKQNAPDIKAFSFSSYLLWKMNEIKAKHIRSNNSPLKRRTFPCKC